MTQKQIELANKIVQVQNLIDLQEKLDAPKTSINKLYSTKNKLEKELDNLKSKRGGINNG